MGCTPCLDCSSAGLSFAPAAQPRPIFSAGYSSLSKATAAGRRFAPAGCAFAALTRSALSAVVVEGFAEGETRPLQAPGTSAKSPGTWRSPRLPCDHMHIDKAPGPITLSVCSRFRMHRLSVQRLAPPGIASPAKASCVPTRQFVPVACRSVPCRLASLGALRP